MAPLRFGVHRQLEDEANRLIKESLKGVTRHSEKADILTPWKDLDRHRREVYVPSGVPDASQRQGMFHRALNSARPDLNSRDGISRGRRLGMGGSLTQHVADGPGLFDPERE